MKHLEIDQEILQVNENYIHWLELSQLSEGDFLRFRATKKYEIVCNMDETGQYRLINIGYVDKDNCFRPFGERFVVENGNEEAICSLSLILLYMANKLDRTNKQFPVSEHRGNYFFDKTKDFLKTIVENKVTEIS